MPARVKQPIIADVDALLRILAARPVLWIGAGPSTAAGYPSPSDLARILREEADDEIPAHLDLPDTFDAFIAANGKGSLGTLLRREFSRTAHQPTTLHHAVARLASQDVFAAIVTTNLDPLIEHTLHRHGVEHDVQILNENAVLPDDGLRVLKIHGSHTDWHSTVLSSEAHRTFTQRYGFLTKQLTIILQQRPVLLVGCSMTEPRLLEWLESREEHMAELLDRWRPIMTRASWQRALDAPWRGAKAQRPLSRGNIRPLLVRDYQHHLPELWSQAADSLSKDDNRPSALQPFIVRQVLQYLQHRHQMGVALTAPFGFEAQRVVDDVVFHLQQPGRTLVAVRLAPDLSSSSEEALYDRLLRDLQFGLECTQGLSGFDDEWRQSIVARTQEKRAQQGTQEPGDAFAMAIEVAVKRLASEYRRTLLLVLDHLEHMSEHQRRRWGFMMNRFHEKLRLLVWGGRALYRLIVEPDESSAFNRLERIDVPLMDVEDVENTLAEFMDDDNAQQLAATIHGFTGGHPALVRDLMTLPPAHLARMKSAKLTNRLLGLTHIARLRQRLARHPEAASLLGESRAREQTTWPRCWYDDREERLKWMGLWTVTDDGDWCWVAPVFERLAEEYR